MVFRLLIFLTRYFLWSRVDRGKRRFLKTMTSIVVDWQNRLDLKRYVWTRIFSKMEKKTSVFKNIRMRVDRQKRLENATCGR